MVVAIPVQRNAGRPADVKTPPEPAAGMLVRPADVHPRGRVETFPRALRGAEAQSGAALEADGVALAGAVGARARRENFTLVHWKASFGQCCTVEEPQVVETERGTSSFEVAPLRRRFKSPLRTFCRRSTNPWRGAGAYG